MEIPSKMLEETAHITRPKIEEHMWIGMHKSTHGEHLSQHLQTNNKQIENAVTFLTGYNGIFNVTNSINKSYSMKTINVADDFIQISVSPGSFEIENLNRRVTFDQGHFTEADYPFQIKPNFSTLGSIVTIMPQGPIFTFVFDDSIRIFLGFNESILYQENNSSRNPVDILSFGNLFSECDIAKGMIYKQKRSGIFHNWTLAVNPRYKLVEKFNGVITWFMMETKDVISSFSFKLTNENNELVSFNRQSLSFRLSIKEI